VASVPVRVSRCSSRGGREPATRNPGASPENSELRTQNVGIRPANPKSRPLNRVGWETTHTCAPLAVTQGDGRDMSRPHITQHPPTRFRGRGYGVGRRRAAGFTGEAPGLRVAGWTAVRRSREMWGHHLYVVLLDEGRQTDPSHVRYGLSHGVPTFRGRRTTRWRTPSRVRNSFKPPHRGAAAWAVDNGGRTGQRGHHEFTTPLTTGNGGHEWLASRRRP
jgi:hypothetical protein